MHHHRRVPGAGLGAVCPYFTTLLFLIKANDTVERKIMDPSAAFLKLQLFQQVFATSAIVAIHSHSDGRELAHVGRPSNNHDTALRRSRCSGPQGGTTLHTTHRNCANLGHNHAGEPVHHQLMQDTPRASSWAFGATYTERLLLVSWPRPSGSRAACDQPLDISCVRRSVSSRKSQRCLSIC